MTKRVILIGCCLCFCVCLGQQKPADGEPRTGSFTVSFDEYSKLSRPPDVYKRVGEKPENRASKQVYKIEAESYRAYVPKDYARWKPFGLIVWINAGDNGGPPRGWPGIMDKHHVIWIGADKTGNRHNTVLRRIPLALDAVHNMTQRYNIDPQRIYVAGFSGGGRVSSHTAICYSDVFKGGLYVCGCNSWEKVDVPGKKNHSWSASFSPQREYVRLAKKEGRYVLLTGDNDFNRENTKAVYDQTYRTKLPGQGHYLQVPGLGHKVPNAEWFEKALVLLDEPLKEEADKITRAGDRHARKREYGAAVRKYFLAESHGDKAAAEKRAELEKQLEDGYAEVQTAIKEQRFYDGYAKLKQLESYGRDVAPKVFAAMAKIEAHEAVMNEIMATRYLRRAKKYLKAGKSATAKKYLDRIVEKYPETKAAAEAGEIIKKGK